MDLVLSLASTQSPFSTVFAGATTALRSTTTTTHTTLSSVWARSTAAASSVEISDIGDCLGRLWDTRLVGGLLMAGQLDMPRSVVQRANSVRGEKFIHSLFLEYIYFLTHAFHFRLLCQLSWSSVMVSG